MEPSTAAYGKSFHELSTHLSTRSSYHQTMDTFTATLDGHRARGAHVLRVEMQAPWSVAIQDEAMVGVLVMVRGEAWLERDGHEPVVLRPGGRGDHDGRAGVHVRRLRRRATVDRHRARRGEP